MFSTLYLYLNSPFLLPVWGRCRQVCSLLAGHAREDKCSQVQIEQTHSHLELRIWTNSMQWHYFVARRCHWRNCDLDKLELQHHQPLQLSCSLRICYNEVVNGTACKRIWVIYEVLSNQNVISVIWYHKVSLNCQSKRTWLRRHNDTCAWCLKWTSVNYAKFIKISPVK